jgi:hypothetical protein
MRASRWYRASSIIRAMAVNCETNDTSRNRKALGFSQGEP